jgi:glyoxylase-like metal-dependent hydrolase (beta-lactamase superfamily II)
MDITTKSGQRIRQVIGGRSNVYLLTAGMRALLIDTGRTSRFGRIVSRLDRLKIDRLDAILLTHTHFDHAENTAALSERYGAKIVVQEQEARALKTGDSRLPRGSILVTRWLMPRISPWLQPRVAYRPTSPDLLVGEAMGLRALGFEATVLHAPGHSQGQ